MAGGNLLKILSNNKAKCYTKEVQLRKYANVANKRQPKSCRYRREIRFLTQLLIRAFVKDYKNRQDPKVRERYGRLASIVGVCCNLLLFAGKLTVGTLFGSIAITADAINNLSDASSNVVSLVGFKLAAKAPDAEHPYGHARYEYVAGLAVSTMIMAIGLSLLKESAGKILHPEEVGFSLLTVAVLCASILVKLWMSVFNRRVGLTIESETLIATAADSRNDVISTSAVLVSAILCKVTGFDIIDGIMGLGVAVFILWSGWGLVRDTLSPLLGESPSPELVEQLEKKVLSYPRVLGVHDMMVHDYGPGRQFASLHVEFPTEVDPLEAHDLIDNIEHDVWEEMHLLLTIHYDPIVTSDARVGVLRARLVEEIHRIDPSLSMHDLRLVPGPTHTNVLFDLVFPAGYNGDKQAVRQQLEAFISQQDPTYICKIKVEQSYIAAPAAQTAKKGES